MARKKKLKSDHPFTRRQLETLNEELAKITDVEIGMKGVEIPSTRPKFIDIKVLHSPYSLDVFLKFTDISVPDYPRFETYKIDSLGRVDYFIKRSMQFNSLADRITFFNELMPIKFEYV